MTEAGYGFLDRTVHRLAFGRAGVQDMLSDLETRLYGKVIAAQQITRPVFVTGLPRAGTTLILEILSRHPDVVTHGYRDMPFLLSPVVWQRLSGRFRARQAARERAHGDGMSVSPDSPEAFEEVVWLRAAASHYTETGITPWAETDTTFADPLRDHIRRLLAARQSTGAQRYISKNNANIARLGALQTAFPDADILVPLRNPFDHARSLHGQHMRFSERHRSDPFARDYMRDIGHFEFGALHRPILFPGMAAVTERFRPEDPNYWLAYWIAAHHAIAAAPGAKLLDMSRFTEAPKVAGLYRTLGLAPADTTEASALIRPIKRYDPREWAPDLHDTAATLHHQLTVQSLRLP